MTNRRITETTRVASPAALRRRVPQTLKPAPEPAYISLSTATLGSLTAPQPSAPLPRLPVPARATLTHRAFHNFSAIQSP